MNTLAQTTFADLLGSISARTPAPGGGAAASAVGALGAALGGMVMGYSDRSAGCDADREALAGAGRTMQRAQGLLLALAQEDADAYALVTELKKLDQGDLRREQLSAAQAASLQAPIAVIAVSIDLLRLFQDVAPTSNTWMLSDLAIAAILADATVRASAWMVAANLPGHADRAEASRIDVSCRATLAESADRLARIESACRIRG